MVITIKSKRARLGGKAARQGKVIQLHENSKVLGVNRALLIGQRLWHILG